MAKKKQKKFNKIKLLKKISREDVRMYGKSGVHADKRERRVKRMSTLEYLDEYGESERTEQIVINLKKSALTLIESTYGTLDQSIVWDKAAEMRVGSVHQEYINIGTTLCKECGPIEEGTCDAIYHPEVYLNGDIEQIQLTTICKMCGKQCLTVTAHLHQGVYIGICCWDERLKITE